MTAMAARGDDLAVSRDDCVEDEDRTVTARNEIHIVIAGKSGAGKSTIASNIFGVDTRIALSADPITLECTTHRVTKHGITVLVTDTVGPQEGKGKKKDLKKLSKHTQQHPKVDLLVYCLSITPSAKFVEGNPAIMRSLQKAYGKEIWKHCVLVFTFGNYTWKWCEDNIEEDARVTRYEEFVNQYTNKFRRELEFLKVQPINVQAVLDLELEPTGQTTIAAVPAGDKPGDCVLPRFKPRRIHMQDQNVAADTRRGIVIKDWRDVVFIEIIKKCSFELQKSLLRYRYHSDIIDIAEGVAGGMAGGAAFGAGVGAGLGFAAGPAFPIAAPITSAIGALIGAVVAGLVGASAGGGVRAKTTQNE